MPGFSTSGISRVSTVGTYPAALSSGAYVMTSSPSAASSSAVLGNGTLRVVAWVVPCTISIARIGTAVVTTPGEAGSKFRLGIFYDNGFGYPGAVAVDAGQIDGTSATVQEITLGSALVLGPGVYWIGGACQSAPTTQPTIQTVSGWTSPVAIQSTTQFAAGATVNGYSMNGVTGALSTFGALAGNQATACPRVFVKLS